ncbi:GATA domain-containing protein [Cephalotus follicularis]|uniref:GATA domain-containing protein n=1 Tax=Cephalotus follicularis TaxID=3775 RepID=A0A1Q3DHA6_CEPFO|nr:GATA domain-containing protein [Cephalotus follicularis]
MMDQSEKVSDCEETNNKKQNGVSLEEIKKTCADCGTTKTPLWRGGPAGPKSLCNACGIRSRKKRRAILGLNKDDKKAKRGNNNNDNMSNNGASYSSDKLGDNLKQRMLALGREVLMRRSTVEKRRKKLGEEEQAAVLLMALSYGSVYA